VFRPGAKLSSRQSGQELDRIAHEIACGVEERLQISLEDLFRRAAASEAAAVPIRKQAMPG